jgi:hypothetical protein
LTYSKDRDKIVPLFLAVSGGNMYCRNCGKELIGTPELCMNCGAKPLAGSSYCNACGAQANQLAEICVKCGAKLGKAGVAPGVSNKSRLAITLFSFFLGQFGAHRFYSGHIATAIVMLILTIIGYVTLMFVFGFIFLVAV